MSGAADGPDSVAARAAMVDALRGRVRRPAVAEALAAVPRHLFLPGVALAQAYDPGRAVPRAPPTTGCRRPGGREGAPPARASYASRSSNSPA